MNLCDLNHILEKSPAIVKGNILKLGLVQGLTIIDEFNFTKFINELDSYKTVMNDNRKVAIIVDNEMLNNRFPSVYLDDELDVNEVNQAIFNNFDNFSKLMPTQSMVINRVEKYIDKDLIILLVVDGLSYFDCFSKYPVKPCLVEGVTKTKEGYLSVIGQPSIGQRLFELGFFDLRGYSYWDRDNDEEITNKIFKSFPTETMKKVVSFDEIIEDLEKQLLYKSYVQIVMGGLDHLSHHSYDEPIIEPYIDRIFERLAKLEELARKKKRSAVVLMTSDHGILWRSEHNFKLTTDYIFKESSGIRYTNGNILRDILMNKESFGTYYSLLKYPYITKKLAAQQWGVHGGVSAWESIVPMYEKEV